MQATCWSPVSTPHEHRPGACIVSGARHAVWQLRHRSCTKAAYVQPQIQCVFFLFFKLLPAHRAYEP